MTPPKEGSRKRKVFDALQAGGAEDALRVGIDAGLKESSIRGWIAAWSKGKATLPRSAPSSKAIRRTAGKERIVDLANGRTGVLIAAGPEQSMVIWDEIGAEQAVPNIHFGPARERK